MCLTGGLGRGAAERCSKSPNSEFVLLHEGDDATILSIVRGVEDGNVTSTQVRETTLACIKYNQIWSWQYRIPYYAVGSDWMSTEAQKRAIIKKQNSQGTSSGGSQMWCAHWAGEDVSTRERGKSWNSGNTQRQVKACPQMAGQVPLQQKGYAGKDHTVWVGTE